MEDLREIIGVERELDDVSRSLKSYVQRTNAPAFGALQVTCSDESEQECIDAFQKRFVDEMLPSIKFWSKSAFRLANLGGRYEWGAIRVAESHFATADARAAFKCMLVKINAHVAAHHSKTGEHTYGPMERYHDKSVACGALHAMLDGTRSPAFDDLRETFGSEGHDRAAALCDAGRVDPSVRSLFAAVVSARLQARRAVLDIQDHHPESPTVYMVVPCVTLNRPGYDTEIVCGVYEADTRSGTIDVEYCGLGDDPAKYELTYETDRARLRDDQLDIRRPARDHRELVHQEWKKRHPKPKVSDRRLVGALNEASLKRHRDHAHAKLALRTTIALLADLTPISAAVLLFSEGLVGVYHTQKVHTMARDLVGDDDARRILQEIHDRVDHLPPERIEAIFTHLASHYHAT